MTICMAYDACLGIAFLQAAIENDYWHVQRQSLQVSSHAPVA